MKKYNKRNFSGIWFYVVLLAIVLLIFSVLNYRPGIKQILYSDLLNYIKSEQITEMVIEDRKVTIALKEQNPVGDSNKRIASIPSIGILYENAGDEIQKQLDSGSLKLDTPAPEEFPWWVSFLPTLLTVGIFIAFWFFFMRQAQGGGKVMSFGKSTAKMTQGSETHVTFKDVAGADEEKEELEEIVDFLRDSSKFIELGARIPKGILLVGPPGTGKTLLAKAVAGEAKVPFFSISGSDFVEMFVGVGASRVRDLFEQAKKNSPSIIFIDEIDAVGRHRGAGLGGGHDEREQTLNQLLVEMDGFGANEGIIIIAATNRPDILDPALLRPGRFDRQVVVNTPDAKGREEILKVHSRAKPLASDVDLSVLAKTTSGFTGADLENLMNEAALLAAKKGQKKINMKDIEDSVIKVIAGPEKRSKVVSSLVLKLTFSDGSKQILSKFPQRLINEGEKKVIYDFDGMRVSIPIETIKAQIDEYNGHKYMFFDRVANYKEAKKLCEYMGGYLATISSNGENDFLFRLMKSYGYDGAYFGFTDAEVEGTWKWVNGEKTGYTNWHPGEPNAENENEDYAMFYYKFNDGTWNDGDFGGDTVNGGTVFICEWN